jgi:hypothetical protein
VGLLHVDAVGLFRLARYAKADLSIADLTVRDIIDLWTSATAHQQLFRTVYR